MVPGAESVEWQVSTREFPSLEGGAGQAAGMVADPVGFAQFAAVMTVGHSFLSHSRSFE